MTRKPKDLGVSVQARLRNVARERGHDMQLVLTQFTLERLLHRVAESPHRDDFLLKGALLFVVWTGLPHRATRDLDLLGYGSLSEERLAEVFESLCTIDVEPDGVVFDPGSIVVSRIREDQTYEGLRVVMRAEIGTARIAVQVDVGFGDAVHPGPETVTVPTLLDHPAPTLRAYPRATVVAEKFEAMVSLGMLNSRMKDFFDLQYLAKGFEFDRHELGTAIRATFLRRATTLPNDRPTALQATFAESPEKQVQWRAFLRRTRLAGDLDLAQVVADIDAFLWPAVNLEIEPTATLWPAGGPWGPSV